MSRMKGWLAGCRVLDLSQYLPGPLCSLFLADMGAEVIKVERPGGDPMASLGPRLDSGGGLFHRVLNVGKTTVEMDLKDAGSRDEFLRMVRESDVLIEGFRPGVMARLGLDYSTLKETNPGLIYCSISGYGQHDENSKVAGHDGNYLALSGVLDRNGVDSPVYFDPPVADVSGSLFALSAILGALHGRRVSGQGCMIDLALADVIMPLQSLAIADYGLTGHVPKRGGTYLNGGAAYYRIYRTMDDRFLMLGAVEPHFWEMFCRTADHPEWVGRHVEPTPQTELIEEVQRFFLSVTQAEAQQRFSSPDCCVSPIFDLGEAMRSPRVLARGLVKRGGPGEELHALFPVLIDGEPPEQRAVTTRPDRAD